MCYALYVPYEPRFVFISLHVRIMLAAYSFHTQRVHKEIWSHIYLLLYYYIQYTESSTDIRAQIHISTNLFCWFVYAEKIPIFFYFRLLLVAGSYCRMHIRAYCIWYQTNSAECLRVAIYLWIGLECIHRLTMTHGILLSGSAYTCIFVYTTYSIGIATARMAYAFFSVCYLLGRC